MTSFKNQIRKFEDFTYTGTKDQEGSQGELIKPSFKMNLEGIPPKLKEYDQWVVWSLIQKEEDDKKPIKLPTRKVKGIEIKNASLKITMSYTKAVSIYEADPEVFAGVGFVFKEDDPFVFIDLDGVSPGDDRNKYADVNTFVEFSQSGKGLHVICKGKIDKAHKPISGEVEIYSNNRFCAITGTIAGQKRLEITDQQALIDELIEAYPHESSGMPRQESTGFQLPDAIPEGGRNTTMWAFACSLANKNIPAQEMIQELLEANSELCHPPLEESEISGMMERATDFIEREREASREAAEEIGLEYRYALVSTNNTYFDLELKIIKSRLALNSFHSRTHRGIAANGVPLASTYINNHIDRLYCDGLIWFPQPYGSDQLFVDDMGLRYANTWKGFPTTPAEGDIQPWLNHLEFLFPNPVHRQNVIEWIAFIFQHPDVKCNWQLVIQGDEGAGKDALFEPISRLLGSAATIIGNKDVKGNFDDSLIGAKFVTFSEASSIKGEAIEYLKRISASENAVMRELNPKGKEKVWQHNLWAIVVITNHTDALKLSPTERRFYVLSSEDRVMTEKMTNAYFNDWLEKPGALGALFHFLLEVNLDSFKPNALPERTIYFQDMKDATDNDMESTLTDWNELKIKSFIYDMIHPEWVQRDLGELNTYFEQKDITKWLNKNGWIKPLVRPVKKINGSLKTKSTKILVRKNCNLFGFTAAELYNEIEKVEKLIEDSKQEQYLSMKTS